MFVYRPRPRSPRTSKSILAVDLGERVGTMKVVKFLGREIRGIRRHHAWLRRRLQEKKLLRKLKQIEQKERRIVKDTITANIMQI